MFKARHKLNQELEFSDHSYFYLQCAKVYRIIEIKEFELFFSVISTEKQNKLLSLHWATARTKFKMRLATILPPTTKSPKFSRFFLGSSTRGFVGSE